MKPHRCATRFARGLAVVTLAAALAGCAAALAEAPAPYRGEPQGPLGSPFADRARGGAPGFPLVLDRSDLSLGVTAQFARMPSLAEIGDVAQIPGLRHVVISLAAWPPEYAPLEVLDNLPEETDALVILPGYPPSRAAAAAWNLVQARLRLVVVVREPPPSAVLVADLNNLRALERVIVETQEPARTGFERLQRPLSFRVLKE